MALLKIKQKRSLQRRRAIIDAATRVFGEKGVHAATLTDVSHAAGVPLSSIYDYFEDKVRLLTSLPEATFEEFYAQVDTLIATVSDPSQKLSVFYRETLRYIERNPAWARVFFLEIWPSVLVMEPGKNLRRFDGRSSVLTWLTRIAINRCRTHQRKQWLRKKFLLWNTGREGNLEKREGAADGAGNQLIADETIHQVHAAIGQLPQPAREVIVLRYLEELSIDEIARTLNLPRGTVDVRLTRARQQLEKILKPHFEP